MADFAASEHGVDQLVSEAVGGVSRKCEDTASRARGTLPDTADLAQRQWCVAHHPPFRGFVLLLVVVLLGLAL